MKVLLFEEHSSTLYQWWREHTHARTVIYLDAHLDLQYVNSDRLARLRACTSADQIAALAKPHALCPDRNFSYSLENFLFPAAQLGLIDRLVWVAPPHVPTGYSPENFDRLCQMDGLQFDELCTFKKGAGGWIEGRMLGLDLIICDYQQLERIPLPSDSLIDIDIDYFVALPADEPWVNPRAVFDVLRRLPTTPPFVTISRSVDSGFTPLRYRFFADYLAALWEGRERDGDHFDRLYQLEQRLRAGDHSVLADCRRELERHPECAATWYLLSQLEQDRDQAARCRTQAASLLPAYRPNLLRSVCEIRSRQLAVNLADVIAMQKRVAETSVDLEERGLAEVEFGLIYCVFGELGAHIECYRHATGFLGEHPELALEIAKLLMETGHSLLPSPLWGRGVGGEGAGHPEPAIRLLNTALEDDKTRTAAHMLLAQIDATRGLLEPARQHLERANEAAPVWGQLLDMLAVVHQRLGNAEQAQALRLRIENQRRQVDVLARQLM